MDLRLLNRFAHPVLLATALTLLLAAPALAHGPESVKFTGGSIDGLRENDARTQFSFDNVYFEFAECGELANELTCTWSIEVVLHASAAGGCAPAPPESTVIWSSGEQSGNGSVDSGPRGIQLDGCRDQVITVSHSYAKTYGPWQGEDPAPWFPTGGGWSFDLLPVGLLAETEQEIINASPPARPDPMPTPPPALRASSDCRSLFAGPTRYVFSFKGLGCRKATRLASSTRFGDAPSGYSCVLRSGGGGRCVREGNAKKYVVWHLPRKRATAPN